MAAVEVFVGEASDEVVDEFGVQVFVAVEVCVGGVGDEFVEDVFAVVIIVVAVAGTMLVE